MVLRDELEAICVTAKGRAACRKYLGYFNVHMPAYGIDTPARVAAFLAQVAHESADFTRVTENLNYSAFGLASTWPSRFRLPNGQPNELAHALHRNPIAIANHVYANRMGNGDVASEDGWRYRGRGLKQLTGRANYAACGEGIGLDLIGHPELLEEPDAAVESACWYWREHGLNALADAGDFEGVTRRINGGLIGHGTLDDDRDCDRVDYYARALRALERRVIA